MGLRTGPACEAGLSAGMRRQRMPPHRRKKERKKERKKKERKKNYDGIQFIRSAMYLPSIDVCLACR